MRSSRGTRRRIPSVCRRGSPRVRRGERAGVAARMVVWPRLVVARRGAARGRHAVRRTASVAQLRRSALPSSGRPASPTRSRRDSRSARRVGRSSRSRPRCRRCARVNTDSGSAPRSSIASFAMLFALGLAGRGGFKGDGFVAASVVGVTLLVALFTLYPVARILALGGAGSRRRVRALRASRAACLPRSSGGSAASSGAVAAATCGTRCFSRCFARRAARRSVSRSR